MSKVSMSEAAKLFDVSRPTLTNALKNGKISADHIFVKGAKVWQFDMSELKRLYRRREGGLQPDTLPLRDGIAPLQADPTAELRAEIKLLEAKLEAEREARALVQLHLDDLRNRLPPPEAKPTRRVWWPF